MKKALYEGPSTSVKCMCGIKENYNVGVRVHQSSTLGPYWFTVFMDEYTKEIQDEEL